MLDVLLDTPLGDVYFYLDGKRKNYKIISTRSKNPDADDAYNLEVNYIADGGQHTLQCVMANDSIEGIPDSGEHIEATSFCEDWIKMTIGTAGEFGFPENCKSGDYDYNGAYLKNGIEIHISNDTKSQKFTFGISWTVDYKGSKLLNTPLGDVHFYLDGKLINYKIISTAYRYPNVDDAYSLEYDYLADGGQHILQCVIDNDSLDYGCDSSERVEATSFHVGKVRLTIGTFAEFYFPEDWKSGHSDYDGAYLENGLELHLSNNTKSQKLIFGIAWIVNYTDGDQDQDFQVWHAAC